MKDQEKNTKGGMDPGVEISTLFYNSSFEFLPREDMVCENFYFVSHSFGHSTDFIFRGVYILKETHHLE